MKPALWLLPVSLLLAACSLLAPDQTGSDVLGIDEPERWAASPEARAGIDGNWIQELGGRPLVALVAEAHQQNPDLRVTASRVEQARLQGRIAESAIYPQLNGTFNAQRQRQNFVGFPIDPEDFGGGEQRGGNGGNEVLSTRNNTFRLGGEIQWEIDLWGRVRANRRAAIADYQASQAELSAAQISLAAEVARAWFALAETLEQQQLARDSLEVFGDTERVLSRRFEVGDDRSASAAQIRLARTDVASAEANLSDRGRLVDSARRQLELLLGRYPQGELEGKAKLPSPPPRPPVGLPSELLLRRPDLIAAERRFAAAGQRSEEARKALFPNLTLTANGGTSTDSLEQILNSEYGIWSLAAGVAQPILRGGEIRAQRDLRYATEEQVLAELQGAVLQAFGEVEEALGAEQWLASQETFLSEAVELASQARQAAQRDYAEGSGDVLTMLEAQRRELQLRSQLLELRRARLDNRISLHLALGGSFELK